MTIKYSTVASVSRCWNPSRSQSASRRRTCSGRKTADLGRGLSTAFRRDCQDDERLCPLVSFIMTDPVEPVYNLKSPRTTVAASARAACWYTTSRHQPFVRDFRR